MLRAAGVGVERIEPVELFLQVGEAVAVEIFIRVGDTVIVGVDQGGIGQ